MSTPEFQKSLDNLLAAHGDAADEAQQSRILGYIGDLLHNHNHPAASAYMRAFVAHPREGRLGVAHHFDYPYFVQSGRGVDYPVANHFTDGVGLLARLQSSDGRHHVHVWAHTTPNELQEMATSHHMRPQDRLDALRAYQGVDQNRFRMKKPPRDFREGIVHGLHPREATTA